MKRLRLLAAAAAALAAFAVSPGSARAQIEVVATIKPIHGLVARVMEGVGTPKVLIAGSASPHSYAMKPSDAKALNKAQVFFRVGEAIEPFTGKIVKSLPSTVQVVTLVEAPGVQLLDMREGGAFEAHEDHDGDDHKQTAKHDDGDHDHEKKAGREDDDHDELSGGRDHHVWLDPENAKAMAAEIARVLADKAPEHAAKFRENAAKLSADIDGLAAELDAKLKPVAGRPFVVFHDAYQYFERRFGLNAVGSITVTPNASPSAKRLAAIRAKIKTLGAVCVFAEPQYEPKLLLAVIEGTAARTGKLDPEGMALDAGPGAYFKLMRNLGDSLGSCLRPSS